MKVNMRLLVAQVVLMFAVFALVLFGAAGSIRWTAGWTWLALFFAFTVAISLWLLRANPALLTERMTGIGKADQKTWDKVFFAVLNVIFLGWLVLMPLDAVRFGWSHVPAWLQLAGGAILVWSFYLFYLVFRENSFLSPAVRIQSDRGQTVVSTGPYGVVRHPMYATAILFLVGTDLLLGSAYGLLACAVLVAAIAYRAVREEDTLREELAGYDDYMAKVRYRLIPGIW